MVFFVAQVAVAYNWRSLAAAPKGIVPDHPYSFLPIRSATLAKPPSSSMAIRPCGLRIKFG